MLRYLGPKTKLCRAFGLFGAIGQSVSNSKSCLQSMYSIRDCFYILREGDAKSAAETGIPLLGDLVSWSRNCIMNNPYTSVA